MGKELMKQQYLDAAAHFQLLAGKEEKLLLMLSVSRLLSFAGGIILIWFGFTINSLTGTILVLVITGLFFYLLKLYSAHSAKKDFLINLVAINRNEAAAVDGDLSGFEAGNGYTDANHDFSYDVDLFGNASLFHYMNRTVTGYGRDILAGWFSDPYAVSPQLTDRQEAIKEISSKKEWRQVFMAHGMKKPLEKSDIAGLLKWLGEDPLIKSSLFKRFLIFFLPTITITSLLLLISGILDGSVFTFIFLFNLLYITIGLKRTNTIHNTLSKKYKYLSSINELLEVFGDESFTSSVFIYIKKNISGKEDTAAVAVNKLSRLIQVFDSRMNLLVGVVLNGLLLWDYHCIYKLEKWKSDYKDQFPGWLEMLGQVDAYISLGNYAYNNPGYVYPVISDKGRILAARNMGHPLINENVRVCNDIIIERQGTVCIISGANMAGKSTFLRTIAVSYILGMIGAPVCAEEMSFIPPRLFTSMRTTDSLSGNESYFYAEQKRLKMLKSGIEKGEPVFFILDEILKGTNSADKSIGSKLFLKRLVELGGTGLIATHDTSLGEMENDYPGLVINKCFEIEIDGETIHFDYKLQDGITKKMNAALLMKQMGILE